MSWCIGLCVILMCYERNNIGYDKFKKDFETDLAMKWLMQFSVNKCCTKLCMWGNDNVTFTCKM